MRVPVLARVVAASLLSVPLTATTASAKVLSDTVLPRGSDINESTVVSGGGNAAALTSFRRGSSRRAVARVSVRIGTGPWGSSITLPNTGDWQLAGVDASGRFVAFAWRRSGSVLAIGEGGRLDLVAVPAEVPVDDASAVAVNADGGIVVAGCQAEARTAAGQPVVATRTPAGIWSQPVLLDAPNQLGCAIVDVDMSLQGAAVAYGIGDQSALKVTVGAADQWSAPVTLPIAAGWSIGPMAMARTTDGGARVAWFDSLPRLATFRADGSLAGISTSSLGARIRPTSSKTPPPRFHTDTSVAVAPSGMALAAWWAGGDRRLLAVVAQPGRNAWNAPERAATAVSTGSASPSGSPQLTVTDTGEVVAGTTLGNLGPGGVPVAAVAATRTAAGRWIPPRVLGISRRLAPSWETRGGTAVRVPPRTSMASLLPVLLDTQAINNRTKVRRAAPEVRDVDALLPPKTPRVRVLSLVTSARRFAKHGQLRFRCSIAEGGECVVTSVTLPPAEARRLRVAVCPRTAAKYQIFETQTGAWVPRGGSRLISVNGIGASRAIKRYERARALGTAGRPCNWPYAFLMRKLGRGRSVGLDVTVRALAEGRTAYVETFRLDLRGS